MVYLPSIPAANDKPAQSQSQIQQNFTQLNTQFGVEHVAFDAATANGQHKSITLQKIVAGAATGTNVVISQSLTPVGNPFIKADFGPTAPLTGDFYSIPLMASALKNIAGGTATFILVDFGAAGLKLVPQTGNIFVYNDSSRDRTIFSPFVYVGGVLTVPGSAGQLRSGSQLTKLNSAGSVLTLETTASIAGNIIIKITGNAI